MSIEIAFGREDGAGRSVHQLATANGLEQLGRWVDEMCPTFENLHHLIDEGWAHDMTELAEEIKDALAAYPAPPNVRSTAEHLLGLVEGRTDPDDLAVIIGD